MSDIKDIILDDLKKDLRSLYRNIRESIVNLEEEDQTIDNLKQDIEYFNKISKEKLERILKIEARKVEIKEDISNLKTKYEVISKYIKEMYNEEYPAGDFSGSIDF